MKKLLMCAAFLYAANGCYAAEAPMAAEPGTAVAPMAGQPAMAGMAKKPGMGALKNKLVKLPKQGVGAPSPMICAAFVNAGLDALRHESTNVLAASNKNPAQTLQFIGIFAKNLAATAAALKRTGCLVGPNLKTWNDGVKGINDAMGVTNNQSQPMQVNPTATAEAALAAIAEAAPVG